MKTELINKFKAKTWKALSLSDTERRSLKDFKTKLKTIPTTLRELGHKVDMGLLVDNVKVDNLIIEKEVYKKCNNKTHSKKKSKKITVILS